MVIANRQTAELFEFSAGMPKFDVPFPDFIGQIWSAQIGEAARLRLAEQCASWPLKERRSLEVELHNGHRLEMTCNPVPDGSAVVIIEDVTERRQHEAAMLYLARHDALTGVLNRRGLGIELERILSHAAITEDDSPALLYLDLDGFKQVNDTFGHGSGDEVLRDVAMRLQRSVRDDELVARLGGDEFAIVIRHAKRTSAAALAQRIVDELERAFHLVNGKTAITGASIGVAFAAPGEPADVLIARADKALYEAKQAGKGTYRISGDTPVARPQT